MEHHTTFVVFAIITICVEAGLVFLALFNPGLRYKISSTSSEDLDSEDFRSMLEIITDAKLHRGTVARVLTNGEAFYSAMLDAIRRAERSVNLEAYIFQKGEIANRFVEALAQSARRGAKVNVVLDGLGSLTTTDEYLKPITDAGGKIGWYHPLRWNTWPKYNNRTHRELMVIDGREAFIGGAGVADHWFVAKQRNPRWRDTVVHIEGDAAESLQSTFVENWLESYGEVLTGKDYFPRHCVESELAALVVNSSPSAGGSTRARILFQALVASAKQSIHITTPYFLPDISMRKELVRAVHRGVEIKILTPGRRSDHALTRNSSRRLYGELLQAGARIFEYRPSMIHAKVLIVDGLWSVVGSTNFDHRSFGINDEVNLAVSGRALAERLQQDFVADLGQSHEVSLEEWRRRPLFERADECLGWILERQQ